MGRPVVHFEILGRDQQVALTEAVHLGDNRLMDPEQVMGGVELLTFSDPEGHMVGLVKSGA